MKAILSFPYEGAATTAELREDHRWQCSDPDVEQLLNRLCPLAELGQQAQEHPLHPAALRHLIFQLAERLGASQISVEG